MIIYDHQALIPTKDKWLLVTITDYSHPVLQITQYVMPDTKRSREWIETLTDFTTGVNAQPIVVNAAPQGVHALVKYKGHEMVACGLDEQRLVRHGQSLDQAFDRVREEPTCGRCKASLKYNPEKDDLKVVDHAVVLKPWSWENVPEDYRPGGPKHRYTEGA